MDRHVYDRMREIEADHWWFAARREILADQIARLSLPSAAEILEVGCGTGGNLAMLSQFGRVQGIEPDAASRAYAGRAGAVVRDGLLPGGLPPFDAPFDLICAFDVIEHVDEDAASVAALAALLKAGGRFIATVPAYQWMWSRHDLAHHHKRRYGLAGARRLFEKAGLKVEKATHFNTLLFPPIAAVRLAQKVVGLQGGEDDAMPSAPVNSLFRHVFAMEKPLIAHADLPFGVSILLIASKPQGAGPK